MKKLFTAFTILSVCIATLSTSVNAEGYYHREREQPYAYEYERGYSPRHEREFRHERRWRRGHALPYQYRREVIRNYGHYHLRRPPYGYHWVRANGDLLLIAISTGVIVDIIRR